MLAYGTLWSYISVSSAIMFIIVVCTTSYDPVLGIKCPPCDKIHCTTRRASRLQCKGGVTTGVCGCCPVCAKLEGEKCGGEYAYLGRCDRELFCVPAADTNTFISKSHTLQNETAGICTKTSENGPLSHQADAGFVEFCRPPCTAEFCRRRPKAACSASHVADTVVECQGRCQHTSCRACAFVNKVSCPACPQGDFRCLKRFGKCIQNNICSLQKNSCGWSKVYKPQDKGQFVCKVPECL